MSTDRAIGRTAVLTPYGTTIYCRDAAEVVRVLDWCDYIRQGQQARLARAEARAKGLCAAITGDRAHCVLPAPCAVHGKWWVSDTLPELRGRPGILTIPRGVS